jgi:hypothetical protein
VPVRLYQLQALVLGGIGLVMLAAQVLQELYTG